MSDDEALFRDSGSALALHRAVRAAVRGLGPSQTRVSRTQVAFRRRRTFAITWRPGRWLRDPAAEVVLSVALPREDGSPRWKQVAHPAPSTWMHHLELHEPADVDDEVVGWLRDAYEAAG